MSAMAMEIDESSSSSSSAPSSSSSAIKQTTVAATAAAALENGGKSNTLPWVEKYRPKKMDDLVAHEEIIGIITKLIDSQKLPHLLLYG
jgi:hypothetical protein